MVTSLDFSAVHPQPKFSRPQGLACVGHNTCKESAGELGRDLIKSASSAVAGSGNVIPSRVVDHLEVESKTLVEQTPSKGTLRKKLARLSFVIAALLPQNSRASVHAAIQKGIFGAAQGRTLADATIVSRGDHESRVFADPSNEHSGLILSGMAYERMSKSCSRPGAQFQVALDAALEVYAYWEKLSEAEKVDYITQHVIASSTFASPLVSLSLNEAMGAYFALGARNASTQVYRGLVSNNNLYASGQPGFEAPAVPFDDEFDMGMPGFSMNEDYGLIEPVERWLTITGNHSIPLAELLSVGGFYFRESIEPMVAIRQNPSTFRTPDDLHQIKNISQIQRKIHPRTVPTLLDFTSEFGESVRHHTNQTVEGLGLNNPDSYDYFPERD